jgi:hypothetical protein|tara:strand:- start:6 stop:653 length:648 start_codon:yes stop_codon:yes gene_type:complete
MPSTIHYVSVFNKEDTLTPQSDLIDLEYAQTKCPVHNHKQSRTFVATSPIDFSLSVDRSNNKISCSRPELLEYDDEHINSPKPVFQLVFPKFLFYTEDDNVWFEFNDHPMTALKNNFIAISGWFNLSNWSRASSTAITLVDEKRCVIIEKGDPLFRVSFYPPNLDDSIVLKKETNTEVVNQWVEAHSKITEQDWRPRLFSKTKTESKCPFSFLFK